MPSIKEAMSFFKGRKKQLEGQEKVAMGEAPQKAKEEPREAGKQCKDIDLWMMSEEQAKKAKKTGVRPQRCK